MEFGEEKREIKKPELKELLLPTEEELGWTGIHLAAAARWYEQEWIGPEGPQESHATGPNQTEALQRWLSSCVRYVQAEINKLC
jgi:hypothetical protein